MSGLATWVVVAPAAHKRRFTRRSSPGATRVMTTPAWPARAVRPERCTWSFGSSGRSRWMTQVTPSTWMPRAATSVATSTWARP